MRTTNIEQAFEVAAEAAADARICHRVTPTVQRDTDQHAIRDLLMLTFRHQD